METEQRVMTIYLCHHCGFRCGELDDVNHGCCYQCGEPRNMIEAVEVIPLSALSKLAEDFEKRHSPSLAKVLAFREAANDVRSLIEDS